MADSEERAIDREGGRERERLWRRQRRHRRGAEVAAERGSDNSGTVDWLADGYGSVKVGEFLQSDSLAVICIYILKCLLKPVFVCT